MAQPPPTFQTKGYAGFGSFQTDVSVEVMITTPASSYTAPQRAVSTLDLYDPASSPPAFGLAMKSSHFFVDPVWTFINHGAFGGACRVAVKGGQRWSEYSETQPLRFIDRELFPLMCHSIRTLAALVKCPPTSLALVPNATYALSSVIGSLALPPGATLFCLDIGYGSVRTMLAAAAARVVGGSVVVGKVSFPLPGGATQLLAQVLPQIPPHCALAVFDTVTSNSGMVLPIRALVAGARARGVSLVLVDGAHSLGAFDLDIPALGADYFVSNCHKWLCSSRGVAMLYCAREGRVGEESTTTTSSSSSSSSSSPTSTTTASSTSNTVSQVLPPPLPRPPVISHGYNSGFTSEFIWDGCRDYSGAVALPDLLGWWGWVGWERARHYCTTLLHQALDVLSQAWGTDTHVPREFYSHMACIQLPPACLPPGAFLVGEGAGTDTLYRCTSRHSKMLQDALHHGFHIEVPAKTLPGPQGGEDTRTYLRISAFVYNTLEDYQRLAQAVLSIQWEVKEGGEVGLVVRPPAAGGEGGGGGGEAAAAAAAAAAATAGPLI